MSGTKVDPKSKKPEDQEIDPDDQTEQNDQDDSGYGADENSVDYWKKKAQELAASKTRVEKESKEWKQKFKATKKLEEEKENQLLEQDGKIQELLEKERAKNKELQERVVKSTTSMMRKELENQCMKLASDSHDVADLISNLDSNLYNLDAENLTVSGLEEALADVRKRKPYLFKKPGMPKSFDGGTNKDDQSSDKKRISYEAWLKLPLKEKKQHLADKTVDDPKTA